MQFYYIYIILSIILQIHVIALDAWNVDGSW